jgi:hypothetical protein
MSTRAFSRRQFLNTEEDGGAAYIKASVNEAETTGSGKGKYFDAEFCIADCGRVVTLDFSVYGSDGGGTANARQKIAKLRRAVVAFEKALLDQLDEVDAA